MQMALCDRLKEARNSIKMTQAELARAVGVSKGAIGNYESGLSSPIEPALINLMKVLNVDANFLYQDYIVPSGDQVILSPAEKHLIDGYRSLSKEGKAYMLQTLAMAQLSYPEKVSVSDPADNA